MSGTVFAPGRVNLIGEHIDYHLLPVLPIALRRGIWVRFVARSDSQIRVRSADYGAREFTWTADLSPVTSGDWENYLRAAAQAVAGKWGVLRGIDAEISSDLPAAAGLSSSSVLIVAMTLALLGAADRDATFEELMEILPEGEQFVGTRGGGMDHAASLASRAGHASLIGFVPLTVRHIPIPSDWGFLVADSLERAEKSGAVRDRYNAVRAAGDHALRQIGWGGPPGPRPAPRPAHFWSLPLGGRQIGFVSYTSLLEAHGEVELLALARDRDLPPAFAHVVTEAFRVRRAVAALQSGDAAQFGKLLLASHDSLRDRLQVSCPALDRLVDAATASGALGARLTGAGFGGCAVVFCLRGDLEKVRSGIAERFYQGDASHIWTAEPGGGAVHS